MERSHEKCERPADIELVIKYKWTEIVAKLSDEKPLAKAGRLFGVEEETPFTQALERVCNERHVNSQRFRPSVLGYAERCELSYA